MKRVGWMTDVHFNFLETTAVRDFMVEVAAMDLDAVMVGGDIGESNDLSGYLAMFESELQIPIYFVLGNHDYYHGSIYQIRRMVTGMAAQSRHLKYLPASGVVSLTSDFALIGHGGWGDGRIGDYANSPVIMTDYLLITELAGMGAAARLEELNDLGDEAALYLRGVLTQALGTHAHILLLTHVPPFKEACWSEGQISDDHYLPHFTCKAVGDMLLEVMAQHPERDLTVLCGHSHGEGTAQLLPNLKAYTGGAKYGEPRVGKVFELP